MSKLTDSERRVLEFLNANAAYQVNTWAFPNDVVTFSLGIDLRRMQRRGLIEGEGRGSNRSWAITKKGQEALA